MIVTPETHKSDYYNTLWSHVWGDMQKYGPIHRHHRRLLLKLLLKYTYHKILDVGCGNGENLMYLQKYFPHAKLAGVDISWKAFNTSKDIFPYIKFIELDVTNGSINELYDLIICFDVLEHIKDDLMALRNIQKMANRHILISTLEGKMRGFEKDIGHVRNYQKGELEEKLSLCGFKIVKKINWGFPLYSPLYRDCLNVGLVNKQTYGQYRKYKITLCRFLYYLFYLSVPSRGDIAIVLAEKV